MDDDKRPLTSTPSLEKVRSTSTKGSYKGLLTELKSGSCYNLTMRNNSLIRDLGIAIMVVGGLVAAYYLVVAGFMTLMILGLITPAWLILLIFILFMKKKKKIR